LLPGHTPVFHTDITVKAVPRRAFILLSSSQDFFNLKSA